MEYSIDRNSVVPYYHQLKAIIRGMIENGKFATGERIPSEQEMGEKYGISRTTVRQAIEDLVNEGLLVRERPRGTFVDKPKITQKGVKIVSFTEDLRRRGFKPARKILEATTCKPGHKAAQALKVSPHTEVAKISRLMLADDIPIAIASSLFIHSLCPGILEQDITSRSMLAILKEDYDIELIRAEEIISARIADDYESDMLDIPLGSAVLVIERVTYMQGGRRFEYITAVYRADRYQVFLELTAE